MKRTIFLISILILLTFVSLWVFDKDVNDKEVKDDFVKNKKTQTNVARHSYYVSLVSKMNQEGVREQEIKVNKDYYVSKQEKQNEVTLVEETLDGGNENVEAIVDEVVNEPVLDEKVEEQEELDTKDGEEKDSDEVIDKKEDEKIVINNVKNGFVLENDTTYYYDNDVKVTGLRVIDNVNNYFSPSGKYLGTNKVKVIDVSHHQGVIDWEAFAKESDCYGVIVRIGYWKTLDRQFERNISELKRLNIPYGIYLFSYASGVGGANVEADFTNEVISKYDLKPTLGIFYDIESWKTSSGSSDSISKKDYDSIVTTYVNKVSNFVNGGYKVKLYSGRWYAMNRLGTVSKSYVDWVAEYNETCKYDADYSMWQYTSNGSVPGVSGRVDISYMN